MVRSVEAISRGGKLGTTIQTCIALDGIQCVDYAGEQTKLRHWQ